MEQNKLQVVMVTGAAGLIGSAVVTLLLQNNIKVIACDNFSTGRWRGENPQLVWEEFDVRDPYSLDRLETHKPNFVIHCAAHPGGRSLIEPVLDVDVNALGSMRIFEWCARHEIPVLYTSSSSIYGDQPQGEILETAQLKPGTIYGVCKLACEKILKILGDEIGLKWVVLRLFSTYGAGHSLNDFQGIVSIMLKQLLNGDQVIVKGALSREKDFLYVEDAATAIYKSITSPQALGNVINIGIGRPTTVSALIEALCDVLGRNFREINVIEEEGSYDPQFNVPNCDKARRLIGFDPKYDLVRGLTEYLKKLDVGKN